MIINAIATANGGGGSKPPVLEELQITENGTYTPSDGVDGFNPVNVNVQPPLQSKTLEITANGQSTLEADSNYYGLDSVNLNINVPIPTFTTEELNATANGTFTPSTDGYSKVTVNVQPSLQAKSTSTTITSNGTSTITLEPDSNYDGLSSASVTITTNIESSGGGKYVVPDGMKFGYSNVFNAEDFDVSHMTDMSNLFDSSKMDNLNLSSSGWITSNVTRMVSMFNYCRIASINMAGLDTSNVTNMDSMFGQNLLANGSIMSIDLSMCNMSKVTNFSIMFNELFNLTDLNMNGAILPKMNITNWGLDTCTKLTVESLVSVINALPQLSSGESYTCTIGSDNLAKLSDEQKAIATAKGWTLN